MLYETVLSYHTGRLDTCLDLGCGHGLVSRAFSPTFKQVYGVDPSAGMIKQAESITTEEKNIQYLKSSAESLPFLPDQCVDLVVAGEAAHWFDNSRLFPELNRVMRPGGTLAFWGYADPVYVNFPKASSILTHYTYGQDKDLLGPYWPQPGRTILRNNLRAIQPPPEDWNEVQRLEYEPGMNGAGSGEGTKFMSTTVTLGQSMEYVRTFSSYHGWKEAHPDRVRRSEGGQGDIVDELLERMVEAEPDWTDTQTASEKPVQIEWKSGLILARKL